MSPLWLIVLTLVAESASLGKVGMERVYTVIVNRAGTTEEEKLAQEILKPYQFSCWRNDALMRRAKNDQKSIVIALEIVHNRSVRPEVGQARHYLTHLLWKGKKAPLWARKGHLVFDEGTKGHVFLEGVDE